MDKSVIDYSLYLVTDRSVLKGRNLSKAVEESILGGVTLVQLREKEISSLDFYKIAKEIKVVTDKYNIPLIINDRLDIAQTIDASGVHLGQSDIPCKVAREILGKDKLVGVSAHNLDEALKAQADGADYIGCGAAFATSTKEDTVKVTYDSLKEIKSKLCIPVVAIGGINDKNVNELSGSGIDGIAVVSAILQKQNIRNTTKELKSILNANLGR
ncbi:MULTISPECIES: thiamine phosphate synthase [Clostridium]|uniref:Thiamine-phosphate synthase n=1 Tax=Clostridium cibarium TaxID=2762247 RepID=A0ABR8PXZ4_9CLOT|nr:MULTISPECIES: thiamine phosphate synthase [Clostridium]MBD7913041.1 thiamine phosphate synthase [Clostridium cibarium]